MNTRAFMRLGVLLAAAAAGGCTGNEPLVGEDGEQLCSLDPDLLIAVLGADAIPALTLPNMVAPGDAEAAYLRDFDRVLGVVAEGEARAYPHNILWHHEIVNDRIGDTWISASYCPLTGSGLVFEPFVDGDILELGVSGLLFANNLVMFDRRTGALYGPQLAVEGKCAMFRNRSVSLYAVQDMSWGRWKQLHPDTKVVGDNTGHGRNYRFYPYGSYAQITNSELLYPMVVDASRPIKERVLAIRIGEGGRGYPFGELFGMGETSVVNESVGGVPTVVFYESRDGETALAFDARVGGRTLTFSAHENGSWTDAETGSTWTIDGSAIGGSMAGERLSPREDSYVLFWFAWKHFQPTGETFLR